MWPRVTSGVGRVLRVCGFCGRQRTSAVGSAVRTDARTTKMQLRTRTSGAAAAAVAPIDTKPATPKRARRKAAASPTVKEEVRASEPLIVDSARKKIKREPFIKQEVVVTTPSESVVVESEPRRSTRRATIKRESTVKEEDDAKTLAGQADDKQKKDVKPTRRKPLVVKRREDGQPEKWEDVLRGIQEMRAAQIADVDVAGVETMFDKGAFAPHIARFHVLISAMLSSQTKDPVNAAAMKRLIARGLTVEDMLAIDEKELALLIRPVGFFNNKAKYIKQVAQMLTEQTAESESADVVDIPDTFDALVALPGVGPKMAHLVMSCAWNNTVGICVDTHVHRISNRLGWVTTWNRKKPKAQDPEKTRKELEDWLPREHWHPINVTLVGFGQTVCLPRGPKCGDCAVRHLCPSAFRSHLVDN